MLPAFRGLRVDYILTLATSLAFRLTGAFAEENVSITSRRRNISSRVSWATESNLPLGWELYRLAFHSPAEPVEKLFFCSLSHHWITPDAKDLARRMMGFQFLCKPVCPLRHREFRRSGQWKPRQSHYPEPANRVLPALETCSLKQTPPTSRLGDAAALSCRPLYAALEALRISFQTHAEGLYIRPLHHEPVCHGYGGADGRDRGRRQ